jgi:hypothetical protein
VALSATEACIANAGLTAANAGQRTPTCGTTRRNDVLTFRIHHRISPAASEHALLEIPSVERSASGAWQFVVPAFRARGGAASI